MLENSKRNPKILGSSSFFILFYLNQDVEFHWSSIFVMEFWVNPPWVKKKKKKNVQQRSENVWYIFTDGALLLAAQMRAPHKRRKGKSFFSEKSQFSVLLAESFLEDPEVFLQFLLMIHRFKVEHLPMLGCSAFSSSSR